MRTCEHNNCNRVVFRTDKLTRKGYCQYHWKTDSTDIDKRSIIARAVAKIKASSVVEVPIKEDNELEKWFKQKMAKSPKRCENCGGDLSHYNEKDWHGSQHHIFEKSIFPSVKFHPLNHGVLGKWCCHSQWHTSLENAVKMPFFKIAMERFIMFEPDIKERNRIPEIYVQEIEPH